MDPNTDELLLKEPKHELAARGLEIHPKIRQSHKMNAENTTAFPAWNLFFPDSLFFTHQNILYYAAIKEAFTLRKQENQNLSMIHDNAKHANYTPELTCSVSKNVKSLEL